MYNALSVNNRESPIPAITWFFYHLLLISIYSVYTSFFMKSVAEWIMNLNILNNIEVPKVSDPQKLQEPIIRTNNCQSQHKYQVGIILKA